MLEASDAPITIARNFIDRIFVFHLCVTEAEMNISQVQLKLEQSIAAVLLGAYFAGDEIIGGALVIPAGEVIRFDRTRPLVSRMLQIEWKRAKYGVFPETLFKCANKTSLLKQRTVCIAQYS
jgi:hypothetical protein